MFRKSVAVLLLLMLLSTATACVAPTAQPTPAAAVPVEATPAAEPTAEAENELVMMDAKISTHPAPHSLPSFIAIDKGWFKDAGLNVTNTTYISGLPQMEALPSGEWVVGVAGIPATITGILTYDLKIIGFSLWDDPPHCMFARPDSDIVKAGKGGVPGYPEIYGTPDLYKGKTFLCAKSTAGYLNLLATLRALGLTENDVNIVHMEISAAYQAFKAGEGDVLITWSTFTYNAADEGWIQISNAAAAGLRMPSPMIASNEIVNDNPELVQRYADVFVAAMQWLNDNPDEVIDIYYNVCLEEGVDTTEKICRDTMAIHYAPSIDDMKQMLEVDASGLNGYQQVVGKVMDFYIATGAYTDADKEKVLNAIDTTFLEKAIANYEATH